MPLSPPPPPTAQPPLISRSSLLTSHWTFNFLPLQYILFTSTPLTFVIIYCTFIYFPFLFNSRVFHNSVIIGMAFFKTILHYYLLHFCLILKLFLKNRVLVLGITDKLTYRIDAIRSDRPSQHWDRSSAFWAVVKFVYHLKHKATSMLITAFNTSVVHENFAALDSVTRYSTSNVTTTNQLEEPQGEG